MSLLMEGETKKRKLANIIDDDEEDGDVKIEKFFALIRSAKEIRDQLLDAEGSSKPRAKKAVAAEKKGEAVRVLQKNKKVSFAAAAAADAAVVSNKAAVVANRAEVIINNQAAAAAAATAVAAVDESSRLSAEETSKKTAEQKNDFKGGRIFLDLNLSL